MQFTFAGAHQLYQLAGRQKLVTAVLPVTGTPLFGPNNSYVILTSLTDYSGFIATRARRLNLHSLTQTFAITREPVDVNKDIASSLSEPRPGIDFWWLNNGVTILASKAAFNNRAMTLQNPLIVNGLQTSYEVNRWARSGGTDTNRMLMVRIIETTDEDVINSVIKATNYQTKVKPHSLRATEQIHRQIEIQLLHITCSMTGVVTTTKSEQTCFSYDRHRSYGTSSNSDAAREA